jgi:PAP2 superfamily C-terminal
VNGGFALSAARAALVAVGLLAWFWTQRLIGQRAWPAAGLGDALHQWTAPLNCWLNAHPRRADALLIVTSGLIDLLGVFLLASAVFGPSVRPFVGLLMLFALRQLCQGLCALPPPPGMIWRHPGVPSLLITYGTATDLFFSGHTAIAVYGAVELARAGGPGLAVLGTLVALIEAATVLVLRAHYTMDVFGAAVTALWVAGLAEGVAPICDAALAWAIGR